MLEAFSQKTKSYIVVVPNHLDELEKKWTNPSVSEITRFHTIPHGGERVHLFRRLPWAEMAFSFTTVQHLGGKSTIATTYEANMLLRMPFGQRERMFALSPFNKELSAICITCFHTLGIVLKASVAA